VGMMSPRAHKQLAWNEKVSNCSYLIPKDLLVSPGYTGPENLSILNSLGGTVSTQCQPAFDSVDYKSFRDMNYLKTPEDGLYPDCAIMTAALFGDYVEDLDNFPTLRDFISEHGKYIAVQHISKGVGAKETKMIATALDDVAANMKLPVVFFAAGTAPFHDSFDNYDSIAAQMKEPVYVMREENVWFTVSTVANAEVVISTSLHIRIMAFVFQKKRATWCNSGKHANFLNLWDNADNSTKCVDKYTSPRKALDAIEPTDLALLQEYEQKYLVNFDRWSKFLLTREAPTNAAAVR
jgi:hypothetical protein